MPPKKAAPAKKPVPAKAAPSKAKAPAKAPANVATAKAKAAKVYQHANVRVLPCLAVRLRVFAELVLAALALL